MGQVRRGSTTTTRAVRATLRRPEASLAALSREIGIVGNVFQLGNQRRSVIEPLPRKPGPVPAGSMIAASSAVLSVCCAPDAAGRVARPLMVHRFHR